MNKSPLTKVLLGVLALISLWSLVLCYSYNSKTRELRLLNGQAAAINFRQQAANALVLDVMKYSQKNPSIKPILESITTNRAVATVPKATKK